MKIVNLCFACPYIDGWGYQENLLPKYHKKLGNEVFIITSRLNKDKNNRQILVPSGTYINDDGIEVTVLDYKKKNLLDKILHISPVVGLYKKLSEIRPDIIFVHGGTSCTSLEVVKYKKQHPNVKLFADQHGDYYNTPMNTLFLKIYVKYIWGYFQKQLSKYTEKYWGVTPWRVKFLEDVYGIGKDKTDLLIMGADDETVNFENKPFIRDEIRNLYNIPKNAFLISSGGKINRSKNIHKLVEAVNNIKNKSLYLILFGTISDDIKTEINNILKNNSNIIYVGWKKNIEVSDIFLASDLVVMPGTHSVVWEQCVACGTPLIVKDWPYMHHVDIGGNCKFINGDNSLEIEGILSTLLTDKNEYSKMLKAACCDKRKEFLYSNIAKKSIMI